MIPKKSRFTTKSFERNFKNSKRFRAGNFLFLFSPAKYTPLFAVVAGKKVSKLAVRRNRLRRQMYSVMRNKLLPSIQRENIICLYNGPEILHNTTEFETACDQLMTFLSRKK